MTLAPKEYIATRRKELKQQIQALEEELRLLARMESALPGIPVEYRQELPFEDEAENALIPPPATRQRYGRTIKQMVLEVLANTSGLLALEILDAIKDRFGAQIERTTLSPQLSRLKADGDITANDNRWHITQNGEALLARLVFQQN